MQVEVLEARANNSTMSDQLALREARASLNQILDRELKEKALFLGNGGLGRLIVLCNAQGQTLSWFYSSNEG